MADARTNALLRGAEVVFVGTLGGRGPGHGLPRSESAVEVRIEEVLRVPPGLTGLQNVTVLMEPTTRGSKVGDRAVFFAAGLAYGERILLREVGRTRIEGSAEPARARIVQADEDMKMDELREHLAQADIVAVGTIGGLREAEGRDPTMRGEHDPEWWVAMLQVHSFEKGRARGKSFEFVFPNSEDVLWYRVPKSRPGMHGVWILHRMKLEGLRGTPYALLHPDDHRPMEELALIRSALGKA